MTKDGGQAFPVKGTHNVYLGMTLKDYFAGQVLIASLSHEKNMICLGGGFEKDTQFLASICYEMADAMIKERDKNET